MKKLLLFLAGSTLLMQAYSQVGNLDPTFGNNGLVTTRVSDGFPTSKTAKQVLVQSDGKLLVVLENERMMFLRYNPDGTIDNSFKGLAFVNLLRGRVALQSDGKIVMAGY